MTWSKSTTLPYERESFFTAEDGTRLFVGEAGNGFCTLVLSDGLGCDGFAWRYLHPEFARFSKVVHWNYRGHGRSGAPFDPDRVRVEDLARDLVQLIESFDYTQVVLVGHSLGSQVSLEVLRRAPDRVVGLVLLCGSYGRVTETFHGTDVLRNVLPAIVESVQRHKLLARALWGRLPSRLAFRLARATGEVDRLSIREEDFQTYWEHVNLMNPETFLSMLRHAGDHSAEDMLGSVSVPTLVIAAERDTFTPQETAQVMAEQIPDAEYLLLRGGSHAAPVEQPQAILRRIRAFLASRLPCLEH